MIRRSILFISALILFSCGERFSGYTELSNEVHVRLLAFDDEDLRAISDSGAFVDLFFSWKLLGDAEPAQIYRRSYRDLNQSAIGDETFWYDLKSRKEGDSLTYLLDCEVWSQSVLSSEFDVDCPEEVEKLIELTVGIDRIRSRSEFATDLKELNFSEPEEEVSFLEQFLEGDEQVQRVGDIFLERYTHRPKGKRIERDSLLRLQYMGYFLDGRKFDRSPPDSGLVFRRGEQGQVLKGIEMAISQCAYGDSMGVYIPPYLAFGARGSGNGVVAPFTPVFYVLKVDSIH